jgi:tRNA nucleotidyltransferase (CCA-adding enzyme)
MIREAVKEHSVFDGVDLDVYAKGSYANNTNVKADSDVDIAVQCGIY